MARNGAPVTITNPEEVRPGSGATAQQVQGNNASGNTDSGNPVKIGGRVSTTSPTGMITGQQTDAWFSAQGAMMVGGVSTSGSDAFSNANLVSLAAASSSAARLLLIANSYFDGTAWNRTRGDTNGGYSVTKGSSNLVTSQVSVGTTATSIVAARAGRGSVKITNLGTTDIYIGNAGVTTTTGELLPGTKGASITLPFNGAVFGIVATGSQSVSFSEVY